MNTLAKPKMHIEIGREYGWFTVLGHAPKDSFGHIRYHVRCRCGHEQDVQTSVLGKGTAKCRECATKYNAASERANIVGKKYAHFDVLKEIPRKANGVRRFLCKCRFCGNISIKTKGQIERRKIMRCEHCPPDYHFSVNGNTAVGILPDGSEFTVDAADVERVSQMRWSRHSSGYIVSDGCRGKFRRIRLHEFLLNPRGIPNIIIDHVNRNKLDCRRSNLRFVTPQQNCMNKSLSRNNKTGYAGVFFDNSMGCYRAKIGINDQRISLGRSDNPIECAQMYNWAAMLLFREFAGHRNDVPEPTEKIKHQVTEKCLPFMADADLATQACSLFSCQNETVAI